MADDIILLPRRATALLQKTREKTFEETLKLLTQKLQVECGWKFMFDKKKFMFRLSKDLFLIVDKGFQIMENETLYKSFATHSEMMDALLALLQFDPAFQTHMNSRKMDEMLKEY